MTHHLIEFAIVDICWKLCVIYFQNNLYRFFFARKHSKLISSLGLPSPFFFVSAFIFLSETKPTGQGAGRIVVLLVTVCQTFNFSKISSLFTSVFKGKVGLLSKFPPTLKIHIIQPERAIALWPGYCKDYYEIISKLKNSNKFE